MYMLPTIPNLHYMNLLNQVHTGLWPARDLLLAATSICVCMCVHPRGFLNQARAGHRPAHAWFLKIDSVWIISMHARVLCDRARGY